MPRKLDLVGPSEIANRLSVSQQVVSAWMKRGWPKRGHENVPVPKPIGVVSRIPIYHWHDVQRWAAATGRQSPNMK